MVTIVRLHETMLEQAILDELPNTADNRYLTQVLPRLLTTLVAPSNG
ncbi:hypothetical protein SAMN05216174_101508 [Actinokineospora iranica]|uniref:Uncharacterized protein n=1 Tax=Actinokineospora iranica TaxID=1271860 RepID=A0A1G6JQ07_9PSEU|nr:hypothetical protein SAMN05216174_101508 [Actinokineospora iranica]